MRRGQLEICMAFEEPGISVAFTKYVYLLRFEMILICLLACFVLALLTIYLSIHPCMPSLFAQPEIPHSVHAFVRA